MLRGRQAAKFEASGGRGEEPILREKVRIFALCSLSRSLPSLLLRPFPPAREDEGLEPSLRKVRFGTQRSEPDHPIRVPVFKCAYCTLAVLRHQAPEFEGSGGRGEEFVTPGAGRILCRVLFCVRTRGVYRSDLGEALCCVLFPSVPEMMAADGFGDSPFGWREESVLLGVDRILCLVFSLCVVLSLQRRDGGILSCRELRTCFSVVGFVCGSGAG